MEEESQKQEHVKYAEQARNANNKTIFKNNVLTCQFLKNYSGIELFSDIKPEDIEDVSDQYVALLGIEFETDTVKKVRIHYKGQEHVVYVLPLIEHKSYVDYDVAMQLLRYMVVIWYDYRTRQEQKQEGISRTKQFRYPLIIPIVYYEGAKNWTADLHLRDRIAFGEMMKDFIPDYTYQLFRVHAYTDEELRRMQDEMSLVVMINKIQNSEDFSEFLKNPSDYVAKLYKNAPADIQEIYVTIIWSLLMKMNFPTEEAEQIVGRIKETNMGYLFENAEDMNIQTARKERAEAQRERDEVKKQLQEATERLDEATERLDEATKERDEVTERLGEATKERDRATKELEKADSQKRSMIEAYIELARQVGKTKEEISAKLCETYDLTEREAEQYWN